MTVIGAFRSHGVPALLGDFLITAGGAAVGTKRKLTRLRGTCVVGWSGGLLTADRAVAHLNDVLGERPDRAEVEAALVGVEAVVRELPGIVSLVGWVGAPDPEAFLWRSSDPDNVHWGGPWYDGSGADVLFRLAGPEGLHAPAEGDNAPAPNPIQGLLHLASNLMSDEVLGQGLRAIGVGHAYEMLVWTGEAFEFVDDIVYCTIQVDFADDGTVKAMQLLEPAFKYSVHDDVAIVARFRPSDNATEVHIMTCVGLPDSGVAEAVLSELGTVWTASIAASHYGVFLDLRADNYVGPLFAMPLSSADQPSPPIIGADDDGNLIVRLPPEFLAWAYALIRADQAASPR